ncbi:hypothetical protein SDJN02_18267, partial [Cucurbita argyrosperma subsp. argyrosperma]
MREQLTHLGEETRAHGATRGTLRLATLSSMVCILALLPFQFSQFPDVDTWCARIRFFVPLFSGSRRIGYPRAQLSDLFLRFSAAPSPLSLFAGKSSFCLSPRSIPLSFTPFNASNFTNTSRLPYETPLSHLYLRRVESLSLNHAPVGAAESFGAVNHASIY